MPDLLCPTCHQPQRWELTYCRRCHAAINCLCCDCDGPADPGEPEDVEACEPPPVGRRAGAPIPREETRRWPSPSPPLRQ
jgi:hypothetical protein